jgi:LPXTG-motif cell wall-anchored protein
MRIFSKLAVLGLLLFTLFPAVAAQAQDCGQDPYCNPDTPDEPDRDANDDNKPDDPDASPSDDETDVLPSESEDPSGDSAEVPVGGGAEVEGAAQAAPSGSLPITGADVVGIVALGAAALGLGTVLVRRSRSMRSSA